MVSPFGSRHGGRCPFPKVSSKEREKKSPSVYCADRYYALQCVPLTCQESPDLTDSFPEISDHCQYLLTLTGPGWYTLSPQRWQPQAVVKIQENPRIPRNLQPNKPPISSSAPSHETPVTRQARHAEELPATIELCSELWLQTRLRLLALSCSSAL